MVIEGIDPERVAYFDEQGNTHHGPGFKRGGFATPTGGVTTHTRVSIRHREHHVGTGFHREVRLRVGLD